MPGTISLIHDYPMTLPGSFPRGMCFTGGPDIWLGLEATGVPGENLTQMVKATGTVIANHQSNNPFCPQALYDAVANQFWTTPGGGAPIFTVSRFDGSGTLIDNPVMGGANPYGQIVINGHYWTGNYTSGNMTELDAATAATLVSSLPIPAGEPTSGTGVIVWDRAGSLWVVTFNAILTQITEATATVANTFDLSGQGVGRFGGLCYQGGFLWGTDAFNFLLLKMNLAGSLLATFPLLSLGAPGPIIFDGTWFWVLDFGGGLSVYSITGASEVLTFIGTPRAGDVANDPVDGPGLVWVTSQNPATATGIVQQFLFTPAAQGGAIEGTFTGLFGAGKIGGGTL